MSSMNRGNEDMREDLDESFIAKVTFYVEVAATSALGGIMVATKFRWLTLEVTAALLILAAVSVLVYLVFREDE